ncbi:MAG: T9SS type A sorting domain-containing protein [Candidatus Marinimicrobia bacterium]|nr:T9SS type A sorting domain-containing protein [Candidatus Neomarinimicrobiota bacterium]
MLCKELRFIIISILIIHTVNIYGQLNRIGFNDQDLFLNGVNVAWINFARDIGPSPTDFKAFADMFLDIHDHRGNAVRLWLHTNGVETPEFDENGYVIGPGDSAISDLRKILDIAWRREVGIILCLWSFDMLRENLPDYIKERNKKLLTNDEYVSSYIENCLVPMVDSLKDHPAVIAWEIFNEAEGMSNEFGWDFTEHVPMADIQKFVNLCAGAIHRTDPDAKVTNGTWALFALTDVVLQTSDYKNVSKNYYKDSELMGAGGDSLGYMDFYCLHYYDYPYYPDSPFYRPFSYWQIDKPLVIAEFHTKAYRTGESRYSEPDTLFRRLYKLGYAGALAWSWTDLQTSSRELMRYNMFDIWNNYRDEVDIKGKWGQWPKINLLNPKEGYVYKDSSDIEIKAKAWDEDGNLAFVEFYVNDSLVGVDSVYSEDDSDSIYIFLLEKVPSGFYTVFAVAYDSVGNYRESQKVNINVGVGGVKIEAESGQLSGDAVVKTDQQGYSGSGYVFMDHEPPEDSICITFYSLLEGNFPLKIGYSNPYDTEKYNFLYVNGDRIGEIFFPKTGQEWSIVDAGMIPVKKGKNTLSIVAFWGWTLFDYFYIIGLRTTLEEDLVAYFTFDELADTSTIVKDASAGNSGKLYNTEIVEGVEGNALSFNGSSYCLIEDDFSLDISDQITICAWVMLEDASGNQNLIQKGKNYGFFELRENNSRIYNVFYSDRYQEWRIFPYTINKDEMTGSWHHFGFVYDGDNIRNFIDGLLDTIYIYSGLLSINDDYLGIGINSPYNDAFFKGRVDEIRIYSRALSDEEIFNIYKKYEQSIENQEEYVALDYELLQNYPNPFNAYTVIRFTLPEEENVKLIVYDLVGRKVKEVLNCKVKPGYYSVRIDMDNMPSGIYFYQLITANKRITRKMILLK